MSGEQPHNRAEDFERFLAEKKDARFELRLYVTGLNARSMRAIENVKAICEEELEGRYHLAVIDLSKQPEMAKKEQVIAVPTLIKSLPSPLRRLIGDLSDRERVLIGLNLREKT